MYLFLYTVAHAGMANKVLFDLICSHTFHASMGGCKCVCLYDRWLCRTTAASQVCVTEKQEDRKSQSEHHRMCLCSEQLFCLRGTQTKLYCTAAQGMDN